MIFRRCEEGGPAERDAAGAGGAGPGRGVTRQQAQADPPTAASPVCPEINVPLNVAPPAVPPRLCSNAAPPAPAAEAPAAEATPEEAGERTAPPGAEETPAAEAAPEEAGEKAAPLAAEEAPAAEEAKPDLTEEQQANLKKTFELMDSNKNGFIEASEFQKACEQFGMPVTEGWVKDIFDKFDINQDATIDQAEFTKLIVAAVM